MLRRLGEKISFTKGLGFRLAALLSVAILPIGLISLLQNLHLSREAERGSEIALLGRTASAAAGERALLQSALGSADALGPAVLDTLSDPRSCSDVMRSFIERSATYVSATFTTLDGTSACNSGPSEAPPIDVSQTDAFRQFIASPGTFVSSVEQGPITGGAVVQVMQPLYRDRDLLGYVSIGLTHELLQSTHAMNFGSDGARIITFNHRGDVLTGEPGDDLTRNLPRGTALTDMLHRTETTFRDMSNGGEERVFTVVPVVPGLVYAMGSWSPRLAGIGVFQMSRYGAFLLPIALWLASLAVAYFAVFRLVLRHVRELRGQMRRFAIGNRDIPPPVLTDAPAEIADVSQTFHNMARILIRDEEAMEAAVAEKTVLLKEVHHRVKNNLQLIASIINMQTRLIDDRDARRVLRSVQDRVAALATIYRNLYQAEHLDSVEADRLIGDIINQMVSAAMGPGRGLSVETDLAPLTLMPDQAVPLSLLATEAFTNALKYAGPPAGGGMPWVHVTLVRVDASTARLTVENSLGDASPESDSTGLGSQLIEAFSQQLDGNVTVGADDGHFVMAMTFRVDQMQPDTGAGDPRAVVLTSAARGGASH